MLSRDFFLGTLQYLGDQSSLFFTINFGLHLVKDKLSIMQGSNIYPTARSRGGNPTAVHLQTSKWERAALPPFTKEKKEGKPVPDCPAVDIPGAERLQGSAAGAGSSAGNAPSAARSGMAGANSPCPASLLPGSPPAPRPSARPLAKQRPSTAARSAPGPPRRLLQGRLAASTKAPRNGPNPSGSGRGRSCRPAQERGAAAVPPGAVCP